ncbi:hypothetical protein [Pseudochryseolinea flava]|uniref:Uncharacterized protein n=1 Tax=Pseudochryseolinea flava TaxID=2059302 RepID=A0A364Y0P4_9BACT|nr:hypothetical protein [Pseudochryseolinea flava]RAW00364.1 hypothetical protein DQQ10_15030 [Pseudochryseolinea flava]
MKKQKELFALLHHLKNCPSDFLDVKENLSKMITKALIADLFRKLFNDFEDDKDLKALLSQLNVSENEYRAIRVATWFFDQPLFHDNNLQDGITSFLFERLPLLSKHVKAETWLDDEDRTEEFVREALRSCHVLIDGESEDEAQDRLDALSTIKRLKILEETNAPLLRMKAIRQAMAEKKAREAANVYGRE